MRNRTLLALVSALCIVNVTTHAPSKAAELETACTVENARMVCPGGKSDKAKVFTALANPVTADTLRKAIKNKQWEKQPKQRERYRRSVENQRLLAQQYADSALRQHKQGKMSAKDYQVVRENFAKVVKNYWLALRIYAANEWYNPNPDAHAESFE